MFKVDTPRRAVLAGIAAFAAMPVLAAAPLKVIATTGMIADMVRQIGGEAVVVRGLMGAGIDPHSYRQTRSDIVAMTRADVTFWHGLYLEAQMEEFLADLDRKRSVYAVADNLDPAQLITHADYDDSFDPHVWMDPVIWAQCTSIVVDELTNLYPEMRSLFEGNASTFVQEAVALDAYSRDTLMKVPPKSRILMTAHDAFGYFGKAYNFDVLGIQGISTESEAGLNRISELVDILVDRKVPAVFVETSVSDRNVRALIEGAAAQGHDVSIGGTLFSDAMGVDGTYEGTWLGMIDHNVTTIARALGADVTARGRLGKLAGAA